MKPFHLNNGRFSLLQELGHGATASVHLAMDNRAAHLCALKILSPSYLRSPQALPRMKREFEMLSQLQDPHIITIYEFFTDPPFFSMELIPSVSLDQWSELRGPMPEDKLLCLAKTLSKTLAKTHEKGIIHRDLKPSNILIRPSDEPVLVDFGMMRVENGAPITATGIAIGTMGFIAPEQFDNAKEAGKPSDIFSLGITLLCLATQMPPYSVTQLLEKAEEYISSSFLRILMRMTLQNPTHRPVSMDYVHKQLCSLRTPPPSQGTLFIPFEEANHTSIMNTTTLPLPKK